MKVSKSLINRVIKQYNLSSPVGRRRLKEITIVEKPIEIRIIQIQRGGQLIENGGCFFLKAADFELSLTVKLAEFLSAYLTSLSKDSLQSLIEALTFSPVFKDKKSLWIFLGKEVSSDALEQYSQELAKVSLPELNNALIRMGFSHKINEINELHKECLLKLNAYAQVNFFPAVYQSLDFIKMQERFYSLPGKVEKWSKLLKIQLFYPVEFFWVNDIVWQEDFIYAANQLNGAQIFTRENEQIWISPSLKFPDENASSFR